MAKNYISKKKSGNSLAVIMIGAVVVVLVLGIIAVKGVIDDSIKTKQNEALESRLNSYTATIGERADSKGMALEDYLSYYGIADSGLNADDEEMKAYEAMTLKNFTKHETGAEITDEEFAAFKQEAGLGDDVTADTTDMEVKSTYIQYYQMQQSEQQSADAGATDAAGAADITDTENTAGIDAEADAE